MFSILYFFHSEYFILNTVFNLMHCIKHQLMPVWLRNGRIEMLGNVRMHGTTLFRLLETNTGEVFFVYNTLNQMPFS